MSGFAANASGQQGARARVEPRPSAPALQESLWQRVEPLLLQVEKPARYIGSELNAASSVPGAIGGDDVAPVSVAFVYPDAYEVGASNQAIAILYDKARALPGVRAERACLPWYDMIKLMREHDIPMFTLESFLPLASFDVIAITIPHELSYTNILELLDLAGVSLRSSERAEGDPLVIGGGPCAFNPEPLAPFFDALLLGEGEDAVADIVDALRAARVKGASRAETLGLLGAVSGMYVPSHYEAAVPGGTPLPTAPDVPACVDKRLMRDFSRSAPPTLPLVPYMEVVHDRLAVEILRGCARGCRFCQAGMTYRPVRERPADTVV
ncbi:MAG: hypothetical protein LBD25_00720, partial [Coriobacteriales bacterium]|nr:hypothetical protein [Coriobacteriales bacterium]